MIDDGKNVYLERSEYDDLLHVVTQLFNRFPLRRIPWNGPRSVWLLPEMGFWHRLFIKLLK